MEQENYDQMIGWFGGLFASNGIFYITTWGQTPAGRTRYMLAASISVHVARKEILNDVIDIFKIGRIVHKKDAYYNRTFWEARNIEDVKVVIEVLEQLEWPLPTILVKQLDLAKQFLETKMPPGRPKDPELADQVQWHRDRLYDEMREITAWKKSVEHKKKRKKAKGETDGGEDAEGATGGP